MTTSSVFLAGASGLVGNLVLERLLATQAGLRILAPVRKPLARTSPRLATVVNALDLDSSENSLAADLKAAMPQVDAYVCCLGTTIEKAGSREKFLAVDRDLVLGLAALALEQGATRAILVSSVGASAQSGNFYLRVKGETERALADIGFARVDLLRPGLLLGDRVENRRVESLMQTLAPVTNLLMPGPLSRYRAIRAEVVAAAAVALLAHEAPGRYVHENAAMVALSSPPANRPD